MAEFIGQVRAYRSLVDAVVAKVARADRGRGPVRRTGGTCRVVRDVVVVLGVVGSAVALLARAGDEHADATSAVALLLAGLAVSGGSAAALMMVFAGRLTGAPRVTWGGLFVGWFSLLAIPISMVRGLDGNHHALSAAGIVLAHAIAILLWPVVLAAPQPRTAIGLTWGLVSAATALVAAAALWAGVDPASAETLAGSRPWWLVCTLVWTLSGLVVVGRASVGDVPGLGIVGAGLAMLGAAQAERFMTPSPAAETAPLFAALRLVAVGVLLCGGLRVLRRALLRLNIEQAVQEMELGRAELRLARAAERDHDLRNGLAGLAGATAVLGGGADTGPLCRVVAGELRRLDGMLAQPTGEDPDAAPSTYAIGPTLDGLVMLRRSIGLDVRVDVEPGLCAVGSPTRLAQVVTNLLANAERHAPGSPVRITARRRDGRIEIRVRDFGPGVRPGRERAVLEPRIRDERVGGLGLGLHLCRTLLATDDATIEILPADAQSPGCVVVLGLPAGERAATGRPHSPQREWDASQAAS